MDKQICPKCGEANELGRTYCWVCYQRFENPIPSKADAPELTDYKSGGKERSSLEWFFITFVKIIVIMSALAGGAMLLFMVVVYITCMGGGRHW